MKHTNGIHPNAIAPIAPLPRAPESNANVHRARIKQIADDAQSLAGAAQLIADRCRQVLDHGGAVDMQQQINFLIGGTARMLKDWGLVEHLQRQGSAIKRPPR